MDGSVVLSNQTAEQSGRTLHTCLEGTQRDAQPVSCDCVSSFFCPPWSLMKPVGLRSSYHLLNFLQLCTC
jgi:hypothetical protein